MTTHFTKPQYIDISQPLRPNIPVWPGDTEYHAQSKWKIDEHCPVNVSFFSCSTHTGTHADAPFHYDPEGLAISEVPVDIYIGPCQVIDLSNAVFNNNSIDLLLCQSLIDLDKPSIERVLFKTYKVFPVETWDNDFISLHFEVIEWLASHGCRLVGVDSPSLDHQASKTLDAHNAIKRNKMAILEGLVFDNVPAGEYQLIAPPLKLNGLDSSPVRALLQPL